VTRATVRLMLVAFTVALLYYWSSLLWPVGAAVAPTVNHAPAATPPVQPLPPAQETRKPEVIQLNRVSYYHAVPEQTDDDPFTSACGPNLPNQIAVSRDLFRKVLPCGARVQLFLDGLGYAGEFIVWDTMAARWSATADVLVPDHERPSWGLTTGWLIALEVK